MSSNSAYTAHPFALPWSGRRSTSALQPEKEDPGMGGSAKGSKESMWSLDGFTGRPVPVPVHAHVRVESSSKGELEAQERADVRSVEDGQVQDHRQNVTVQEMDARLDQDEYAGPARKSFWDPNFSPADTHLRAPQSSPSLSSAETGSPRPANKAREAPNADDDSPYPEVRTSVHPTDDPTLPVSTARAWLLGVAMSIAIPGINQFFIYRYPNVLIQGIVAQLLVHPLGLALARLPRSKGRGWGWINPGEWNVKEHTLVYIMANVSAGSAYATDIIATQRFFYGQDWGWSYNILLVLSTQLLGFSFAGILHRILVTPASMIWPATLVNTALFNTLHARSGPHDIRSRAQAHSRQVFFYLNSAGMFAWSFIPSYVFTALSNFDWVTWIKPNNQIVNLLFGYQTGAGMSLLTFDWGMVATVNNPLATPWWVTGNILAGFLFFIWLLAPILYYTNTFYSAYLPFSSATIFDNTASIYNVTKVLTASMELDVQAYQDYSPVYMTLSSALSYGLNLAALTAAVVHSILFFRKQVWHYLRRAPAQDDIHARLSSSYNPVPQTWYLLLFILNLSLAITTVRTWPTELPVWAVFVALALAGVMVLPIGLIQAVTNMQVGLNVVSELLVGFAVPGKPVAMMIFKTYGYITTTQALGFVQDLKVAHYMHLPPRTVFFAQIVASIIGAVSQLLVQSWLFENVPSICSTTSKEWWCPSTQTFFSSSVLYGLIGPARLFGKEGMYRHLLWGFLLGAALPLITWGLARRWPKAGWKYVCWPVVFGCVSLLPPYLPINFISFCLVGWISQYWIRRRHFAWWSRYNYTLSAAWTCGYALCVILIFFALQLPQDGQVGKGLQGWWGNTVYTTTLDGQGGSAAASRHLGEGEIFGLGKGAWS